MLSGQWRGDAKDRLVHALGDENARAIQDTDISSNIYAQVCNTLSVLYDEEPAVSHPDPEATARMSRLLRGASYSAVMQETQRFTLGLREMVMHVSAIPTANPDDPVVIALRPTYPDLVVARPDPTDPASPIALTECRLSSDGWYWETADATPGAAVYSLREASSEAGYDDYREGDAYPWLDVRGAPVLPYVLYHASISHHLWNYSSWSEIVDGTLNIAVDRSSYHYALRMASFAQRYASGVTVAGDVNGKGQASLIANPATILLFTPDDSGSQPQFGQYQAPFDPKVIQEAVSQDEARLAANAGVPASDLLRTSGDPRSGYALALSREGRREAARKFESAFRRSDTKLMSTIARMCNAVLGTEYLPETGWQVSYRELPLTETEKTQRDDRIISQMQAGLISPAEARSRLLGETIEESKVAIRQIRIDALRKELEETSS